MGLDRQIKSSFVSQFFDFLFNRISFLQKNVDHIKIQKNRDESNPDPVNLQKIAKIFSSNHCLNHKNIPPNFKTHTKTHYSKFWSKNEKIYKIVE